MGGSALKASVAAAIVVSIWIYNAAYNIPILMWTNPYPSRYGGFACYSISDPTYVLAARIMNFYAPLTITWTSNIGIIYQLKRTMNKAIHFNDIYFSHMTRDSNPGPVFSIPGFGIGAFLIPGSRRGYGILAV